MKKSSADRRKMTRSAPNSDAAGQAVGSSAPVTRADAGAAQAEERLRAAEEALRASEHLNRTLTETLPALVWLVDEVGRAEYVNARWQEYTGLTLPQFVQSGWRQLYHPDDLPRVRALRLQGIKQRDPIEMEFRLRRHDGEYRWFLSRAVPVPGDEAQSGRWIGIMVDIDEQKRMEQALRESEERFRAVLESCRDIVYRWNLQTGRYDYVSPVVEEITGFPPAAVYCVAFDNALSRIHPDDVAGLEQEIQRAAAEGGTGRIEYRFRKRGGGTRWFSETIRVLLDEQGAPRYRVGNVRDVTERREAEEALQERTRQLQERTRELQDTIQELEAFSYSVSHDLMAPLRAIAGFSRSLVKKYGDRLDADGVRRLDIIHGNVLAMGQLIQDLLAFSRAGRDEIRLARVDVRALALEIWQSLREEDPERLMLLHCRRLHVAYGDPLMIRQVLVNLLANAVKFTRLRERTVIEIGSSRGSEEVVFSIKDNGVGFDMRYHDKLFAVFQRLHTEEYEGTGIGLAIVQRIVHRHGGRAWAEGETDRGATFFFSLPLRGRVRAHITEQGAANCA